MMGDEVYGEEDEGWKSYVKYMEGIGDKGVRI
jgi:hypothetical protein